MLKPNAASPAAPEPTAGVSQMCSLLAPTATGGILGISVT
jgi:hypothetical protein